MAFFLRNGESGAARLVASSVLHGCVVIFIVLIVVALIWLVYVAALQVRDIFV